MMLPRNTTIYEGVPCDLNPTSFLEMCRRLGEDPIDCTIYCSRNNRKEAKRCEKEWFCDVVLIPIGLLKYEHAWAICGPSGCLIIEVSV